MMPFNLTFRKMLLKYIPQLSSEDIDRHESLIALRHQHIHERNMLPAKQAEIEARIAEASTQAQNIFSITFWTVNLFEAADKIWVARRKLAQAQGNFQQVPSSPTALNKLISAWGDYILACVTNLPPLWGNLVTHTVTANPWSSTVVGIFLIILILVGCPTPPNHPPQITSSPMTQDTVGNIYQYQVTATDQDADTLTFSLPVAPPFLVIDSLTGLVQSDTSLADTGSHQIRVKVTDTPGDSAIQDYHLLLVLP